MSEKNPEDKKEITFVVTTNPLASSAANKKQVRSVAALRSWPERRKRTFEHNRGRSFSNQSGFVLDPAVPVAGSSTRSTEKRPKRDSQDELPPPWSASADPLERPTSLAVRQQDEEPLFETCMRAVSDSCNCVHCQSERRRSSPGTTRAPPLSRGKKRTADGVLKPDVPHQDLALITPPETPGPSAMNIVGNVGKAEPFNQYPVPYLSWFDRVLHHMMNVFAPRGWPTLKITNEDGWKWEHFMTQHALSEPALFYVRLLFATGDLIRLKAIQPGLSYWLQGQAVQAINDALSDPKRATSDALILAVGRIALHESLYGDKAAANAMHRPAQKRMIAMRGGMKALPFPELVKRLMRWSDTVMAKRSGTERLLEDDEDDENFSMKQHVDVLEKWVPSEARDLRRIIKISDLLSPEPSRSR